ncbi:MAG: RHS repeat domain-containing protein [Pyrinomonadaceae bacterium]
MGSPRVITDQTGAIVSRHDYRAFGEEVYSGTANRSNTQGYGQADGIRKQYTGYERDYESGLDFAQARYYNSKLGRFTSVDPLTASANLKNPQSFNRYSYVYNNPYKYTDQLGLMAETGCSAENANCSSSGGMSEFERQYEEGIQTSIDQRRAQAAANSGDMDTFWEIIDGNDDLSAVDENGEHVMSPSERFFVENFFDNGAYFANPNDGDTWDQTIAGATKNQAPVDPHNHDFPSAEYDEAKFEANKNVYIPSGGEVTGVGFDGENNKVVLVYFKQLGKLKNVTIGMFHLENITLNSKPGEDGRRKIGEIGMNAGGGWTYWKRDSNGRGTKVGRGAHVHFEFYKGRYRLPKDNAIRNKDKPRRVNPTGVV